MLTCHGSSHHDKYRTSFKFENEIAYFTPQNICRVESISTGGSQQDKVQTYVTVWQNLSLVYLRCSQYSRLNPFKIRKPSVGSVKTLDFHQQQDHSHTCETPRYVVPYLFQFLDFVVFSLQNLQYLSVLHLTFLLLAVEKREKIYIN